MNTKHPLADRILSKGVLLYLEKNGKQDYDGSEEWGLIN
jgi:hypothetical protein